MTADNPDVVIIGGGVIGLSAAYFLASEGARVSLLERSRLGQGCSHANAGLIVPSYGIPLATPPRLLDALRSMLGGRSAISIQIRPSRLRIMWLLRFIASCISGRAAASTRLLVRLGRLSFGLLREVPGLQDESGFEQSGWLHLYRTHAGLDLATREAGLLKREQVRSEMIAPKAVQSLEPLARSHLAGGVYFPDEAHVLPDRMCSHLARLAVGHGAICRENVDIVAIRHDRGTVHSVQTREEELRAGSYILAAGAASPGLLRPLGLRLPVQPARGYSLDVPGPDLPIQRPLLFGEAHVVATPIGGRSRVTGGFELTDLDTAPNEARVREIEQAPMEYLSLKRLTTPRPAWQGSRPASPDGIPIIGPMSRLENLFLATGHGTLGMTLALVTGRLLADLTAGRPLAPELRHVLPSRVGL